MCFIALYVTEGAMRIISRKVAAARADVNERTLDRLHSLGLGPPRIQLSRRRVGYDDESFDAWLRSRAFTSQAAARAAQTRAGPQAKPRRRSLQREEEETTDTVAAVPAPAALPRLPRAPPPAKRSSLPPPARATLLTKPIEASG
jgi:hypothetical protein